MKKIMILLAIMVLFTTGCMTTMMQSTLGYSNDQLKEIQQTPEPGVVLTERSAMLLDTLHTVLTLAEGDSAMGTTPPASSKSIKKERIEQLSLVVDDGSEIELYICDPRKQGDTTPTSVVLFIHGGGFTAGDFAGYERFIRNMAIYTNSIVVAPMYRLAPEHPYPAGVNDSFLAYQWIFENIESYGGDLNNLFIAGDSAGGNLAEVTTLKAYDEGYPMPKGAILIYPALDMRDVPYLSREYFDGRLGGYFFLDREIAEYMRDVYIKPGQELERYVSPVLADLPENHPPVLMISAEVDPLRDDTLYMDVKLKRAGIPVDTHIIKGVPHGFMSMDQLFSEAKDGFKLIRDFTRELKE